MNGKEEEYSFGGKARTKSTRILKWILKRYRTQWYGLDSPGSR
jgi:hypothetical protein